MRGACSAACLYITIFMLYYVPVADGADGGGSDDRPGACDDDELFVGKGAAAAAGRARAPLSTTATS